MSVLPGQLDLFDAGPREPAPRPLSKYCTPADPGTGPAGEMCRSCKHYKRVHWQAGVHLKCGLMQHAWTHGPGTDIKAGWPACSQWEASDA